jgi:hypothetical protein
MRIPLSPPVEGGPFIVASQVATQSANSMLNPLLRKSDASKDRRGRLVRIDPAGLLERLEERIAPQCHRRRLLWDALRLKVLTGREGLNGKAGLLAQRCRMAAD